jgi:hypothetical protein
VNIKNRLERLEKAFGVSEYGHKAWNFERVSTAELVELQNLIENDPSGSADFQSKLIKDGKLKIYEYQKQT